jgi:uncharacterized protein (TIGR03086 family)
MDEGQVDEGQADEGQAIEHCRRAVEVARRVMATVERRDLDRSTPCAAWDVRALVEHQIWMCDLFAAGLVGAEVPARPVPLGDDDPGPRFLAASAAALDAWQTIEWADMMLELPFSTLPAALGVRVFVGDQLIHAWDLATAMGQPLQIDEDLAGGQLEMMRRYYDPANRGADAGFDLATDCSPAASASDQLIALSGRSPGVGLGADDR